jgi:hypothetical protein
VRLGGWLLEGRLIGSISRRFDGEVGERRWYSSREVEMFVAER